ncbi:hypothetical protein MMC30_006928 [Trapelia coarctata]|nr:hypothetical protein [Trapelia coarctata]
MPLQLGRPSRDATSRNRNPAVTMVIQEPGSEQTPATQAKKEGPSTKVTHPIPIYVMLDPILQPANAPIARRLLNAEELIAQGSVRIPEDLRLELEYFHRALKEQDRNWRELAGYGENNEWALRLDRIGGWAGGSYTLYSHGPQDDWLGGKVVQVRVFADGQYVERCASNQDGMNGTYRRWVVRFSK